MISDDDVKQLFNNAQSFLAKQQWDCNKPLNTQFFRGIVWGNPQKGGCKRHVTVFDKFNVIPKHCFNCYKILIEPQTVVDLFKLMVVFEKLELANDNTRKCIVEFREHVSGTYKGFIYCSSIKEGNEILKIIQKVISEEISKNIPVTLKRGCTEFADAYPEWAKIGQGKTMEYKKEWQINEDFIDKQFVINTPVNATHNSPGYTLYDAQAMLIWLKHAVKTGDLSYLKITDQIPPSFPGVKPPSSLPPVVNRKTEVTAKIGRNAPCICGSGKKYKRCCANK